MAADGSQIKSDIDTNLANKGYRGIRIAAVIATLKSVVDWVTASINSNLSTWTKVSGGVSGSTNDDVYRLGKMVLGRSTLDTTNAGLQVENGLSVKGGASVIGQARVFSYTPDNRNMATKAANSYSGLMVESQNAGPAYLSFHRPGFVIQEFGVDTDNRLVYREYANGQVYLLHINGLTEVVKTSSQIGNRKLVLYDTENSDHRFYGLGVNGNTFRLQVPAQTDTFVFFAGTSPVTSDELARISGTGEMDVKGAVLSSFRTKSGWPTLAELPANKMVAYKDAVSGELRLWVNDGGTRKSILFQNT